MKIGLIVLVFTQLMNLWTVPMLGHAGLAVSISLAALLNASLLAAGLSKRGLLRPSKDWLTFIPKLILANIAMAGLLYHFEQSIPWIELSDSPWQRIGLITATTLSCAGLYFLVLSLLGVKVKHFFSPKTSEHSTSL